MSNTMTPAEVLAVLDRAVKQAKALANDYPTSHALNKHAADMIEARDAVSALVAERDAATKALRLIRDQDQGCGGNTSEAEAWRSAQAIARAALAGASNG